MESAGSNFAEYPILWLMHWSDWIKLAVVGCNIAIAVFTRSAALAALYLRRGDFTHGPIAASAKITSAEAR